MEVENIIRLIEAVEKAGLASFELKEGEFSLSMASARGAEPIVMAAPMTAVSAAAAGAALQAQENTSEMKSAMMEGLEAVTSPLVGVFYEAPGQGEAPFVRVGDRVKKGQTIGIIEAMKLMNEIPATCDGVVESILVKNEQTVEYGQPLVQIRP